MRRLLTIAILALAPSCQASDVTLVVEVLTDYGPAEVARIEVELVDAGDARAIDVDASTPLRDGVRAADFGALPASSRRELSVRLIGHDGGLVRRRSLIVDNRGPLAALVVLDRRCGSVECGEGLECLGARCVPRDCISGLEPSCPDPQCDAAEDCEALSACAAASCAGAVCTYAPEPAMCGEAELCDVDAGCVPDPGGPRVQLLAPASGEVTGSALVPPTVDDPPLRPRLRWRPFEGADGYRLQLTGECGPGEISDCAFASPEVDQTVGGTEHRLGSPLDVSMTPPLGAIYTWRVAPCFAGECTEQWSSPRHLEVGRVRGDLDGDGYPELPVGTRPENSGGPVGEYVYILDRTGLSGMPALSRTSDATEERFSVAMAVGDFDGDGFFDLAVAVPGASELEVYAGGVGGVSDARRATLAPLAIGGVGEWLAAADVDGDGYDDLWIEGDGAVGLLAGGPGGLASDPSAVITGGVTHRGAAIVGDVDGDGFVDLALTRDDVVEVFRGGGSPSTAPDYAIAQADDPYFGVAVGGGDWNGDGLADVIVGTGAAFNVGTMSPIPLGNVYVATGSVDGPPPTPDVQLERPAGPNPRRFGWTLRAADLDSVGADSFIAAAVDGPDSDAFIAHYVPADPTPRSIASSGSRGDAYAEDVALVDLDSDGHLDVVVGASNGGADGQVWVWPRSTIEERTPRVIEHPSRLGASSGWFGASFAR